VSHTFRETQNQEASHEVQVNQREKAMSDKQATHLSKGEKIALKEFMIWHADEVTGVKGARDYGLRLIQRLRDAGLTINELCDQPLVRCPVCRSNQLKSFPIEEGPDGIGGPQDPLWELSCVRCNFTVRAASEEEARKRWNVLTNGGGKKK
jgi:hypothetical protein